VRSFLVEGVFSEVTDSRELYRSPNGDVWFLARDAANGKAFVIHEANPASGGQTE
jgi:hypothetical protein